MIAYKIVVNLPVIPYIKHSGSRLPLPPSSPPLDVTHNPLSPFRTFVTLTYFVLKQAHIKNV